jgi:hypothetical protein
VVGRTVLPSFLDAGQTVGHKRVYAGGEPAVRLFSDTKRTVAKRLGFRKPPAQDVVIRRNQPLGERGLVPSKTRGRKIRGRKMDGSEKTKGTFFCRPSFCPDL